MEPKTANRMLALIGRTDFFKKLSAEEELQEERKKKAAERRAILAEKKTALPALLKDIQQAEIELVRARAVYDQALARRGDALAAYGTLRHTYERRARELEKFLFDTAGAAGVVLDELLAERNSWLNKSADSPDVGELLLRPWHEEWDGQSPLPDITGAAVEFIQSKIREIDAKIVDQHEKILNPGSEGS